MNKGPRESQEYEDIKTIKLQDLEPGKAYVVAEDTKLYTGSENAPTTCVKLPKGTSFGITSEVLSSLQLHFKDGMIVYFLMGELNTDEIKVVEG